MALKKDLREIFKYNLRYYRLKNKFTQEDLADKVGLTDKYISDLERGEFAPSFEKISELAFALNIEPYKLLKCENETKNKLKITLKSNFVIFCNHKINGKLLTSNTYLI